MGQSRLGRKKAETKTKIFTVALQLFLQQGYANTTVEQITEASDVAKGTFFNYFPTKDALLFYLGEQRVALTQELLGKELLHIPSAQGKIFAVLKVFAQANEENKEITALIVREMFHKIFTDFEPEKANQLQFRMLLEEIIVLGQQQGEFRLSLTPCYAAEILISMYFFTLFQWLDSGMNYSLSDELFSKAQIIITGMS